MGLVSGIILFVGLGAVALTQFGTKPYPTAEPDIVMPEDPDKVNIVLDTLPDDPADLKNNG